MRLILAACLSFPLALPVAHAASANASTGLDLLQMCTSPDGSFTQGVCLGFIEAVWQSEDMIYAVARTANPKKKPKVYICTPDEFSLSQGRLAFIAYAQNNPKYLNTVPASMLVRAALQTAFPCPTRGN
jgi:hypothetical protein